MSSPNIALEFDSVVKRFPNAAYNALDKVSCAIQETEFITILGTSGCGKTTFLKMINRLYESDDGTIRLFGENIREKDVVKLRLGIGYVIQQIGLFPHMSVFENIATVPKILKWDKKKIARRVEELLRMVNLDPAEFSTRFPAQLSGGQQQRIGLARAMAGDPTIMLFDEPFGAIDAINRNNLQNELLRIHRQHKKTFIFVTHDIHEAFKLATRVIVMHQGHIQQFDTPENIRQHPATDFVKKLLISGRQHSGLVTSGEGI